MRFRYHFQKIVDLKSNEKTQAEWLLSSAVGKLEDEETSLSSLNGERDELQRSVSEAAALRTSVSTIMMYQTYMTHIESQISRKQAEVEAAQAQVADRKTHLTAKMVEEKVWMSAKEKAKATFTAASLKKEQEELDEIAVTRHKRLS
jgi:flagellar FliJ protein